MVSAATEQLTDPLYVQKKFKMKTDSDLTMAVNDTFNSIVSQIQVSNLNFVVNITPYAAYITLKKTAQVDSNGAHISPSPPIMKLLDQALRDRYEALEEISRLKSVIMEVENNCKDLKKINKSLSEKLTSAQDSLSSSQVEKESLDKKIQIKENETIKLQQVKKKSIR